MKFTLISPKFDKEVFVNLGVNYEYLLLGPFAALRERRIALTFIIVFLSFISCGLFWIYYGFKVNQFKVIELLNNGYRFKNSDEWQYFKRKAKFKNSKFDDYYEDRLQVISRFIRTEGPCSAPY